MAESSQFVDELTIEVRGGAGGDGCVSFRRERRVPRGGPDGGNGGVGGSVILRASVQMHTLYDVAHRKVFEAGRGAHGKGSDCTGRSGDDCVVVVPAGTVVKDAETGAVLADLVAEGQTFTAARGGRGGRGNAAFVSSVNRAPRRADPGEPGERRRLRLELLLLAEVGIVGLPNAGKSTFLAAVSRARPKIASYPFTTKRPILGIVALAPHRTAVFADLPGLVEGAHAGRGLGRRFLRHAARTRLLLHLVDVASGGDPAAAYRTVRREIVLYSPALAARPEIVAATKIDLRPGAPALRSLKRAVGAGRPVFSISSATRAGLPDLLKEVLERLDAAEEPPAPAV